MHAYQNINLPDVPTVTAGGLPRDGTTDAGPALQRSVERAVAAGSPNRPAELVIPPGTYAIATAVELPGNISIRGAGRAATRFILQSATPLFRNATPGTRIFDWHLSDFGIVGTSASSVGLELEDVSTSQFERITVVGVPGPGIRVSGAASGNSVYNTFYDVQVNGSGHAAARGFDFVGVASNEHRLIACRAINCNRGVSVDGCNGVRIIASAFEGNTRGVYVTAATVGVSDSTQIVACRFEGETVAIELVDTNVRHTSIVAPHFVANGTNVTDNATATQIFANAGFPGAVRAKSVVQSRPFVFERVINGGAEEPAVVCRDGVTTSGTPVTLLIETERTEGFFLRGQRGGTTHFQVDASGRVYPGGDVARIDQGPGNPEGVVAAAEGSMWLRTDPGGPGEVLYVKESGGNTSTGWVAK